MILNANPHQSIEDIVLDKLEAEAICAAFRTLTEQQQKVLALRYGMGLSPQDIGAVLGCSHQNVYAIMRGAIQKLRGRLWGYIEG